MDDTELIAAYIGVLRHQLRVPPGMDALASLEVRLLPADQSQRPPRRAPAIARLHAALARLRDDATPAQSLDEWADDLHFLAMFERGTSGWSASALDALMADVAPARPSPKIRPIRRRAAPPAEDA